MLTFTLISNDLLDTFLCGTCDLIANILQAKGLLSEYQQKYNSARAVYRERKKYVDEIDWNMLAVPPSGSSKVLPFTKFHYFSILIQVSLYS